MSARSSYTWGIDGDYVVIIDQGGSVSVTNDVEAVIADLVTQGIDVDSKRVVYRDSTGTWDGMRTSNGQFRGFRILGSPSLMAARAKWNQAPPESPR